MSVTPVTVLAINSNLPKLDKKALYVLAKKLKSQGKD